jgi:hypothetical protein
MGSIGTGTVLLAGYWRKKFGAGILRGGKFVKLKVS